MLTPTLRGPSDLLNKLEREQVRTFHAPHPIHVADHLYNFCVTALAVRDAVFASLGMGEAERQAFFRDWNAEPTLVACAEIANTSKHVVLRSPPTTRGVALSTSTWVKFYERPEGGVVPVADPAHPDLDIVLSTGATAHVYELTAHVIDFWVGFFAQHAIARHEQALGELHGTVGDGVDEE